MFVAPTDPMQRSRLNNLRTLDRSLPSLDAARTDKPCGGDLPRHLATFSESVIRL